MKGWFTENTTLKLIAFLLALILHLFVRGDRESVLALYLQVDINDVRSRSHIYSGKIQVSSSGEFSDWGRGWRPLSHYLTPGIWPTPFAE